MIIIDPVVYVEDFNATKMLKKIEKRGRVCYKSEVTSPDSYHAFIRNIVKRGHESVIEHEKITVRFFADRGTMWDITRHRHASFSIESTRWCNYGNDKFGGQLKFIKPFFFEKDSSDFLTWESNMRNTEDSYMSLMRRGAKPDHARMLLPASLATEIVMTANLREWRHVLKMRTTSNVHPHVRQVMIPILLYFIKEMPEIFDDIEYDKDFDPDYYAQVFIEEDED